MPTIAKIKSGKKAKSNGNAFEGLLKINALRDGWHTVQLGSMVRWVGKNKFVPIPSPFDFVFLRDGEALFVDAKFTKNNTFTFSSLTRHQVESLCEVGRQKFKAGYIVHFEPTDKVVFFEAKTLIGLRPYESLSETNGIVLGLISNIDLSKALGVNDGL